MKKIFVLATAVLFVAMSVSSVSAAIWKFDGTQRFAGSHDGNCYDKDDLGAAAFVWAIAWAFGANNKVCHFEHSNNLAGCSGTNSQYLEQIKSAEGGAMHFGLGEGPGYGQLGIVFDFIKNPAGTVAHYKLESDKNTETNTIAQECAGPMESTYRNLMATEASKRKFITLVSHSSWNENFTGSNGMSHTWSACKGIPGGAIFVDIKDQNGKLGTSARWEALKSIGAKNGKTQADWDWLFQRQTFKVGDVSDCGMAYFIFTDNADGTPALLVSKFGNPTPTSVMPTPAFPVSLMNNAKVNTSRTGNNLTVSLVGSRDNGSVKIYNMMNRLVCSAPLSNGTAVVPMTSKSSGTYVINVQAGNRTVVSKYLNR